MDTFLATAKAWAALAGALLTALVGTLTPDDPGYRVLTIVLALVTALAVFQVPNRTARPRRRPSKELTRGDDTDGRFLR